MRGFDRLYGLECIACSDTEVRARVTVREEVTQPYGLVHGGVYASIAESIASLATALRSRRGGLHRDGSLEQHELPAARHRGRRGGARRRACTAGARPGCGTCASATQQDRLCALTRMTIAVRPRARRARADVEGASRRGLPEPAARRSVQRAQRARHLGAEGAPAEGFGRTCGRQRVPGVPGSVDGDHVAGRLRGPASGRRRRCRPPRCRLGIITTRPAVRLERGQAADLHPAGAGRAARGRTCFRASSPPAGAAGRCPVRRSGSRRTGRCRRRRGRGRPAARSGPGSCSPSQYTRNGATIMLSSWLWGIGWTWMVSPQPPASSASASAGASSRRPAAAVVPSSPAFRERAG